MTDPNLALDSAAIAEIIAQEALNSTDATVPISPPASTADTVRKRYVDAETTLLASCKTSLHAHSEHVPKTLIYSPLYGIKVSDSHGTQAAHWDTFNDIVLAQHTPLLPQLLRQATQMADAHQARLLQQVSVSRQQEHIDQQAFAKEDRKKALRALLLSKVAQLVTPDPAAEEVTIPAPAVEEEANEPFNPDLPPIPEIEEDPAAGEGIIVPMDSPMLPKAARKARGPRKSK